MRRGPVGTIPSASDVTDTAHHNSKPQGSSTDAYRSAPIHPVDIRPWGQQPQVARAPETAGFGREEQSGPALLLVRRDSRPPAPNAAAFHPRRGSELQVGGLISTRDPASPLPFPVLAKWARASGRWVAQSARPRGPLLRDADAAGDLAVALPEGLLGGETGRPAPAGRP